MPLLQIHVTTVVLSLSGFVVRYLLMLADSPVLRNHWVRTVPHVIDTVLLAAGIGLALRIHQYPFVDGWLTAKVLGLVGYIVLGSIAIRRGRTKTRRAYAGIGALIIAGYIVGVAVTRSPTLGLE